jgi:hypothetical protein
MVRPEQRLLCPASRMLLGIRERAERLDSAILTGVPAGEAPVAGR